MEMYYRRVILDPLSDVYTWISRVRLPTEEIRHHDVVSSFTNFVGYLPSYVVQPLLLTINNYSSSAKNHSS
jgi:hypothetical protein